MTPSSIDLDELRLLLNIPEVEHSLGGHYELIKTTLREKIAEYKKGLTKQLLMMPKEGLKEYEFVLSKLSGEWETTIENDPYDLPVHYIVPEEIQNEMVSAAITPSGQPGRAKYEGENNYECIFYKFTHNEIAGTVYISKKEQDSDGVGIVKIKLSQYLSKEIEEQWRIVRAHVEDDPELKKELCKLFFINLLPASEKLKELIS